MIRDIVVVNNETVTSLKSQIALMRSKVEKRDRQLREGVAREKALLRETEKLRLTNVKLRASLKESKAGPGHVFVHNEGKEVKKLKEQLAAKNAYISQLHANTRRKDARIEDLELSLELLREAHEQAEESIAEEWRRLLEHKKALELAPLVPDTPEPPAYPKSSSSNKKNDNDCGNSAFDSPTGIDAVQDDSLFVIDALAEKVASSERKMGRLRARAERAERTREAACMTVLDALNREKSKVAALQALVMEPHAHSINFRQSNDGLKADQ